MKIKCNLCGDIIEGDKRGTLISCKCNSIYIDETPYYVRLGGDLDNITELDENNNELKTKSKYIESTQKSVNILENKKRIKKINYYLNIAEEVSTRSTCLKRRYGSILVNNDEIISSGYNGAPRKISSCLDFGYCRRNDSSRGKDYSDCPAVHSEMNTIISASRREMIGADLYLVGLEQSSNKYIVNPSPCSICKRLIINAGIEKIYVRITKEGYKCINVKDWTISDLIGGY